MALGACLAALVGGIEAQEAGPPRTLVVLRISREFLVKLTRQQFSQDEPIDTSALGATVVGSAHVDGNYQVRLQKRPTESDIDLQVRGDIATQMVVTRRPVRVCLHGAAPFEASRRVVFDGRAFTAHAVCVNACYHAFLDDISTLHGGPAEPVVRRLARPIVLRNLPEADATANRDIRSQVARSVTEETDPLVGVLNEIVYVHVQLVEYLRRKGMNIEIHPLAFATTDESVLVGAGFAPGEAPALPAEADAPHAPVEIWVRHRIPLASRPLLELARPKLREDWAKIRPKITERIARHSPRLAQLFSETGHEVDLDPIAADRDWHVIRFARSLATATAPATSR